MPNIVFTQEEQARVTSVLKELNPSTHELTRAYSDRFSQEDWAFIQDYIQTKMRTVLETGLVIRSVSELARSRQLADASAARKNFLRALWTHNFSFHPYIEEAFTSLAGSYPDSSLCVAIEGLLDLGEDLMFDTFDDAYWILVQDSAQ